MSGFPPPSTTGEQPSSYQASASQPGTLPGRVSEQVAVIVALLVTAALVTGLAFALDMLFRYLLAG